MIELKSNVSFAKQFNIEASDYKKVYIADVPFSVRQSNALLKAGCRTLENLLDMTIDELYSIKNLGKTSIDGIIDYLIKMDFDQLTQSNVHVLESNVIPFRKYKQEILAGDFIKIDDQSLDETVIEKFKMAYEDVDYDLVKICINEPEKIKPYAEMLNSWIFKRNKVIEAYDRIPSYRLKNKAIGYIEAFANFYLDWEDLLFDNFRTDENLEDFLKKTIYGGWKNVTHFISWCAKDIRKAADEFIIEQLKNYRNLEIVKYRKEGKTLDEIGTLFGVTRERIRQIELKMRRKACLWAKSNNILRLILADLNSKNVITERDFEKLLGENGNLLFYLLADNDEAETDDFVFNNVYRVFLVGEDLDFLDEEEYVDKLPIIFPDRDYQEIIQDALTNNSDISEEQLKIVLAYEYQLIDGFYKRKHGKISITTIYGEVLRNHFEKGIHAHLEQDIDRFKKYVQTDFGLDISKKSDRSIYANLARIGVICDRGTICPKRENYISEELREKIHQYIIENKNPLIFINSIFSIFEEELNACGIDNRYFLQGVLKEEFSREFYITKDYISREPVTNTIYTSVVDYIKTFSFPIPKEQIFNEFPGLSEIMLNFAVANDSGIMNYFGQYMHIDQLKLLSFDKVYLNKTMNQILADKKPHHDEEIFRYIKTDNPGLLNRIYITFPYSLYSFLECLYGEDYQFARPYIARNDVEIGNPYEQIKEYIIGEECIDIEDVLGIAKELHYQVNSILEFLKSFSDTHILISNEQIATLNYIGINSQVYEDLEMTIANEIQETVPIRELKCLHLLKKLNVPWTDWLIYSIVNKYGKRLETEVSNNQFRFAVPLISPKGQMNVKKYIQFKPESSGTFRTADNLDNIDDLIANLIDEEIEGDIW